MPGACLLRFEEDHRLRQVLQQVFAALLTKDRARYHELACEAYSDALVWGSSPCQPPVSQPLVAALYSNRSLCHTKMGRNEQALQDADNSLGASSTFLKAYVRKVRALQALGRHEEAVNCAETLIERASAASSDSSMQNIAGSVSLSAARNLRRDISGFVLSQQSQSNS